MPDATDPDAHGQAALLLVESLMHALVADGVIAPADAARVAADAAEVAADRAADPAAPAGPRDLLAAINATFAIDAPR